MPTITIDLNELKRLIGKDVSDAQLKEVLPLNKLEIEEWGIREAKLEATPDRPDLFSVEGIARQLRGWLDIDRGLKSYFVQKPKINLITSSVSLRPCITSAVVRGLDIDNRFIKSIMQLQELLDFTLGRDRRKVAIGLHDMEKLKPPFYYKEVLPEEISFVPLGFDKKMSLSGIVTKHPKGRMYAHLVFKSPKYPIILDSKNQVMSFPPIINSELTKVKETTKDMFIDITGTDDMVINQALNILVTAMEERGGKIEGVKLEKAEKPNLKSESILVEGKDIRNLLGIEFKNEDIKQLLERMNYGVVDLGRQFEVLIPPYRTDILHQVDVIEDIAIAYGYNDFIPEVPKIPATGEFNQLEELSNKTRELMTGLGFQEVLNYTLTSKQKSFQMMNIKEIPTAELKNPISGEYSICRPWLLPSLVENLASNKHRKYPQRIFEISDCIVLDEKTETKAKNLRKLSGVISHSEASLSEIISIINSIKENMSLEWVLKNYEHSSFIPGRCGIMMIKGKVAGFFGEVHPKVLNNWQLEKPVVGFEIDIEEVFNQ